MEIQDSLKLFIDLKEHSSEKGFDYLPIFLIVVSSILSGLLAYFSSKWSHKNDVKKIRLEQENLSRKVDYDLKQMLFAIESDNYRILYQKKLDALKKIREIQFKYLETGFCHYYDSYSEFMNNFSPIAATIEKQMEVVIIEYSYVFNNDIILRLKDIYHDTVTTFFENDIEDSSYLDYPDRIIQKFRDLVEDISSDLNFDINKFKQVVK